MNNQIKDESSDRKYFVLTPRLVWALTSNPFEYTLWSIIKDIAGESGECILGTRELAVMTMMSSGKVSSCRQSLIDKGLLKGMVKKDPGYPQPVWHLTVPNLWKRNIDWCEKYPGILERVEFKKAQILNEKSVHLVNTSKERSPHEQGTSPHEQGTSPGERKKNLKEDLKEKQNMAAVPPAVLEQDKSSLEVKNPGALEALSKFYQRNQSSPDALDLADWPVDTEPVIRKFCSLWSITLPRKPKSGKGGDYALWIKDARLLINACGEFGIELLDKIRQDYVDEADKRQGSPPYFVSRPGSLIKVALAKAGWLRSQGKKGAEDEIERLQKLDESARRREYARQEFTKRGLLQESK